MKNNKEKTQRYLVLTKKPSKSTWKYLNKMELDYVYGIDSGAVFLIKKKIYTDLVLGDFDNLTNKEREVIDSYNGEIVYLDPQKDVTDLEYACKKIGKSGEIIAYVEGNRMDHSITQFALIYKFNNLTILSEDYEISYTTSEKNIENNRKYYYFGLFSFDPSIVSISNAKYNASKISIDSSSTNFSSNEWIDGKDATIKVNKGGAFVIKNKFD